MLKISNREGPAVEGASISIPQLHKDSEKLGKLGKKGWKSQRMGRSAIKRMSTGHDLEETFKRLRLWNIPTWVGKGLLRTYRSQGISWQLLAAEGEALFFGGAVGCPSSSGSSHTREHISSTN